MNLTTLNLLDELFPPVFQGLTAPKGYLWKVVRDPTRNAEEPGLFYGSLFRLLDIMPTKDETSPWPDGIIFQHIETGQRLTFEIGQPRYLNMHEETVQTAIRNRKDKNAYERSIRQGLTQSQLRGGAGVIVRDFVLIRNVDVTGCWGLAFVVKEQYSSRWTSGSEMVREPYALGIYSSIEELIALQQPMVGTPT